MNFILSLCLFISMFSGAAPIPAVPDTATETLVHNISLEINGESASLNPELALTEAVGSEATTLRFEIRNGEKTLMPVAGEITGEGARFTLMDSGRIYSISEDTLLDLMEIDAESKLLLDGVGEAYMGLAKICRQALGAENMSADEVLQANRLMAEAVNVPIEACTIEVDGEQMEGFGWEAEMDYAEYMKGVEALLNSDIPLMAETQDVLMDLYRIIGDMTGMQIDSISDIISVMPDQTVYMQNRWTDNGDTVCSRINMEQNLPELEAEMRMETEQIVRGDVTDLNMRYTIAEDERDMLVEMYLNGRIAGTVWNPEMFDLDYGMQVDMSEEAAVSEFGTNVTSHVGVSGNLRFNNADGRKDMLLTMDITGIDDAGALASLRFSSEEIPAENGAEGSCELAMDIAAGDADAFSLALGWDYAQSRTPAALMLPGDQTLEITADFPEEVSTMLTIDGLGLLADVSSLSAEPSVMEIANLLNANMNTYEEAYELQTVYGEDDAAAVFEGKIPAYTPPKGYILDNVEADEWSYCARYINGERSINLYAFYYGEETFGNSYYQMQADGTLAAFDQPLLSAVTAEDGSIFGVNVLGSGQEIYMEFSPTIDASQLEALVAGLVN